MSTSRDLRTQEPADAGVSLIEVLVALMVFAILSTGIVAGLATISRLTVDNRARVVAAGLAAQDVALARAVGDPYDLSANVPAPQTSTVDGRLYTVTRSVRLVSQTGIDVACNTSSDLFYARVNVRVTWTGQLATTQPVQDDTVVASQGRINDSATGSATVSVIDRDGNPEPGVQVRLTPTSSGSVPATQPADTDANGCTRAGALTPGNYKVTLTKTGFKDTQQQDVASRSVLVTAGTNQSVSVQYDQAATLATSYVPWPLAYATTTPQKPANLGTTFLNTTAGPYTTSVPAATVNLHPFSAGYTAVAGVLTDGSGNTACAAYDPQAWPATSSGVKRDIGVRASSASNPGATSVFKVRTTTGIPMGVVTVTGVSGQYLKATPATPPGGSGNPGCATAITYTFSTPATTGTNAILLPYGSYTISAASSPTGTFNPVTSGLATPTNVNPTTVPGSGVVTLDPRPAAP